MDIRIKIYKSQSFREDLLDGLKIVINIIEAYKKAGEEKKPDKYEIFERENPGIYNKLYKLGVFFLRISIIFIALFFILALEVVNDLLPFHSEQVYEVAMTLFSIGIASYLIVVVLGFGLSKMADNELEKYKNRKNK